MLEFFRKKQKDKTKPPEPEFDTPLTKWQELRVKTWEFLQKPWVRPLIGFLVIVILFLIFLRPEPERDRKNEEPLEEDKRMTTTADSMEKVINASAKGAKDKVIIKPEREKEKRLKLNSPIAVFVAEPEKPIKIETTQKRNEKRIKLGLPSGTKIHAVLVTRIFSFNVTAPVIALVQKDFKWNDRVVIPKNSKFLGEVDIIKSIDRVNIRFDRLIFPDGREIQVRAMALSEDGSGGLKGKVEKHRDRKFFKAIVETAIGTASLLGGSRRGEPYSLEDQARSNLFENLTRDAQGEVRNMRIETSITVERDVPISVLLLEAV